MCRGIWRWSDLDANLLRRADDPIWVCQLEISTPFHLDSAKPLRADIHRQVRVFARLHGEPLGLVNLPLPSSEIEEKILDSIWAQLGNEIRDHLEFDGITPPDALTAEGIPSRQDCRISTDFTWKEALTVVVCTRNRPEILGQCLKSLKDMRYEPFQVIVVDNAPDNDDTKDLFEELVGDSPRFRYVVEPLKGLSNARNCGLSEASTDYVVFTDDDVIADPHWLHGIARGFAQGPSIGCVTGLILPASLDSDSERYFDRRVSWSSSVKPKTYNLGRREGESDLFPFDAGRFGTGANFAVNRHLVQELGDFDVALGAGSPAGGGEDLDMFVRILRSGKELAYSPAAIVWHSHRADQSSLRTQMRSYGVGLGAYLFKQLADREFRRVLLRHVPRAVLHILNLWKRGTGGTAGNTELVVAEIAGIVKGPAAYLQGRNANRRLIGRKS